MITIEKLNAFGADVGDGLARCCGMEALYLRLAGMAPDDGNFEALRQAVEENRLGDAFEAAHALKGMLGNLSLMPLYEKVSQITELLRTRTQTDYAPLLEEILAQRDRLRTMRDAD